MKKPNQQRILELNQGAESKNLMETLAIDFNQLLLNTLNIESPASINGGILQRMQQARDVLINNLPFSSIYELRNHQSDTIRGLVCYVAAYQSLPLSEKILLMQPLADDANAGVREWAWLSLRPNISDELITALELLVPLTNHTSENIRRFACEISRPRGVWCSSIEQLRQTPWLAESLIAPLKSDPALYVQKSVGNWLNDAAKDHPQWVTELMQEWQQLSQTKSTHYIAKRALRSLKQ